MISNKIVKSLFRAIEKGDLKSIKKTMEKENYNDNLINCKNVLEQTPLQKAILAGKINIVRYLIDFGADFTKKDEQGNTILHLAVEAGSS